MKYNNKEYGKFYFGIILIFKKIISKYPKLLQDASQDIFMHLEDKIQSICIYS